MSCHLKTPPLHQCCCTCKFLKKTADGSRTPHKSSGHACTANPNLILTNWPEHSCGCELHTIKEP